MVIETYNSNMQNKRKRKKVKIVLGIDLQAWDIGVTGLLPQYKYT